MIRAQYRPVVQLIVLITAISLRETVRNDEIEDTGRAAALAKLFLKEARWASRV